MFPEKLKRLSSQWNKQSSYCNSHWILFLDAYIENGENILDDFQVRVLDGVPNPETVKQLETLYHTIKKLI